MSAHQHPSRRQVLIAGGLGSGLLVAGAWKLGLPAGIQRRQRAGIAFGTTVSLKAMHHDASQLEAGLDAAWAEIVKVQEAASLFDPESALSRLNRDGVLTKAPGGLTDMLRVARDVGDLTNGAFDVTVQPLWRLYETSFKAGRPPTPDEIERMRDFIDYRNIEIDGDHVRLTKPGMAVTLNGIAQGHATEQCLRALQRYGVKDAILNTGEIGVAGQRDGVTPWTAGIADPRGDGTYAALVHPLPGVLATSGDYGTAFTTDFATHHIFDPKTLRSPARLASVSVLAQSGALADALATAMMVMGPEDSMALAGKLSAVEVLMIDKRGAITRTAGFPAA